MPSPCGPTFQRTLHFGQILGVSGISSEMGSTEASGAPKFASWRDAANAVNFETQTLSAAPNLRPLDRLLLGSPRIVRSRRKCVLCEHCGRPVLLAAHSFHTADCAQNPSSQAWKDRRKKEQQVAERKSQTLAGSVNGDVTTKPEIAKLEKSSNVADYSDQTSETDTKKSSSRKKRQADELESSTATTIANGEGPVKKKVKRVAKPRGREPYNPDKHCGVLLNSGQPCARSLTCKVHSMGAKRAVSGRSQSFDVLLASYQRETVARQAAAAAAASDSANASSAAAEDSLDEPFSPEREVAAVIEGVRRSNCFPLYRRVLQRTKSSVHGFRMREMLALALLPKGASAGSDGIFGRTLVYRPDAPAQGKYVRASMIQRYVSAVQQQQRRQLQARQAGAQQATASGAPNSASTSAPQSQQQQQAQQQAQAQQAQQQQQQARLRQRAATEKAARR